MFFFHEAFVNNILNRIICGISALLTYFLKKVYIFVNRVMLTLLTAETLAIKEF